MIHHLSKATEPYDISFVYFIYSFFFSPFFFLYEFCSDISKIKILVPGAGLGRLTYELAYRGYYCEGNEFSLFMLVASNFVLNKCIVENQYSLHPYVHQYVNNCSRKDQVISVTFPDVSPVKAKPKGGFNMVAGDFLQVSFFAEAFLLLLTNTNTGNGMFWKNPKLAHIRWVTIISLKILI